MTEKLHDEKYIVNDTENNNNKEENNRFTEEDDPMMYSYPRGSKESPGDVSSVNQFDDGVSRIEDIILNLRDDKAERMKVIECLTRAHSCNDIRDVGGSTQCPKWCSVENGMDRRFCGTETSYNGDSSEGSRKEEDVSVKKDDGGRDSLDGGIVDELEFQTSLKNERHHFLFSGQLIEGMEALYTEEYLRSQRRNGSNRMRFSTYSESDSRDQFLLSISMSNIEDPPHLAFNFSKAEVVAMSLISNVSSLLGKLNACDARERTLPFELQSLMGKVAKQSTLSVTIDNARSRQDTYCSLVSQADIMTWPVGGCSILAPDMSLPTYIVSRSPLVPKRSATLSTQQNTCPGCQCAFNPIIARRLRLCHYYCLYFCSVCHNSTLMLIPAHILTKWDFTTLPVSRPAYDLLQLIHHVPLFSLDNFADSLQSTLRVLVSTSRLRHQARLLLQFIETCREGTILLPVTNKLPSHWFTLPPLFSIADFRMMESGKMEKKLRAVVLKYTEHISLCTLCHSRGFICELCDNKTDVIFPFDFERVRRCHQCHACFHSKCYAHPSKQPCPRCERRIVRDNRLKDNEFTESIPQ